MFHINFPNDWIRTWDLECRKRPLCQLSPQPLSKFFQKKVCNVGNYFFTNLATFHVLTKKLTLSVGTILQWEMGTKAKVG